MQTEDAGGAAEGTAPVRPPRGLPEFSLEATPAGTRPHPGPIGCALRRLPQRRAPQGDGLNPSGERNRGHRVSHVSGPARLPGTNTTHAARGPQAARPGPAAGALAVATE